MAVGPLSTAARTCTAGASGCWALELTDEATLLALELTDEAALLALELAEEAALLALELTDEATLLALELTEETALELLEDWLAEPHPASPTRETHSRADSSRIEMCFILFPSFSNLDRQCLSDKNDLAILYHSAIKKSILMEQKLY